MDSVIRVTDPENLRMITDLIHDQWFEVDQVRFEDNVVTVPIGPEWSLEVSDVESVQLQETEGVGRYDVNTLTYSERGRTLEVRTGVPLVFRIKVTALDVSLSERAR